MCEVIYENFKAISIYCESLDGECFDFDKCDICKYGKKKEHDTMSIKEIRQASGLSQSQFSKKFGIPINTISQWETEKRNPPSYIPEMIAKILRYENEIEDLKEDYQALDDQDQEGEAR